MNSLTKQLRPLLFLTFRQFVNGLKRALTSPRRLISLLVFLGYYFVFFIRPALVGSAGKFDLPGGNIEFPPLQIVEAVAFGFMAVMSVLLLVGVMGANTGYKPADVDVLFSTPISSKAVLTFRLVRDYLVTVFLPLFIAILGLRPVKMGWEAIFKNMPNPAYSGMALRFLSVSWMLMALVWVAISYAVSLYVNRSDVRSDRIRVALVVAISLLVASTGGYVGWFVYHAEGAADYMRLAQDPLLRGVFFTATLATSMVIAPLSPQGPAGAIPGLLGLLGMFGVAWWLALRQVGWLYDQAAIKAFNKQTINKLQGSGDVMGVLAEQARRGKFKVGKKNFIHRLKWKGGKSLLWKELLLQSRSMKAWFFLMAFLSVFLFILPVLIPERPGRESLGGNLLLFMGLIYVFSTSTWTSMAGFIELLKRVDLMKPLPFSPTRVVFMEVLSKAVISSVPVIPALIIMVANRPSLAQHALGLMVLIPSVSIMMSATTFLLTMLFPDVDDPSQRQFRGLLMMVAFVIFIAIPAGATIGLIALNVAPFPAVVVGSALALAISLGITVVSTPLYANFNPSD